MASSRLPGKVMLPILGKSLLARMIERLQMIRHKAEIIIASSKTQDDDIIINEAINIGIPYYRGSLNNLLDRHYQAAKLHNADVVLKIPSDCPLIDPRIVDHVLDYFFGDHDHGMPYQSMGRCNARVGTGAYHSLYMGKPAIVQDW
jgi:spore coat polysaccharide biosynthesis protein SpsF